MEYFKDKYQGYRWDLVQSKRVRSVYVLSLWGVPELYMKIYHPDSLFQKLRNLIYPKTLKELRILERLRDADLPVPEAVDHMREGYESALVTKAIHPATVLTQLPEDRQVRIMLSMASRLLRKGFFYKDCHAGNFVLDATGKPILVDAYAVSPVDTITGELVTRQLSQIASSYPIPEAALENCLDGLLPPHDWQYIIEEIRRRGMLSRRRLVSRRVSRSLREGSFSQMETTDAYRAFIVREHPVDLRSVIREHSHNLTNRTHILKFQNKTQLSIVQDLCVKSYAKPKPFTPPYALRSWRGLLTLFFNGLPVADPVAVVLGKNRTSVLITKLVPERDLNRVLYHEYPAMPIQEKMEIARELGKLLGTMHGYNIYHADLKASNIKLRKNPISFVLLDTDRVIQGKSLARHKRLRNLAQINNSIPRNVKKSVRMAFIRAYAAVTGDNPKRLFEDVWNLSRNETITYRTDDGERSESWLG